MFADVSKQKRNLLRLGLWAALSICLVVPEALAVSLYANGRAPSGKELNWTRSDYQAMICLRYRQAEDEVDVETLLEEMDSSPFAGEIADFLSAPACEAILRDGPKVPALSYTAVNPLRMQKFPQAVHDYFIDDKKNPAAWLKAVNAKSSDGTTLLDIIGQLSRMGMYGDGKKSDEAARTLASYLCKNGGVYARNTSACNPNEDAQAAASLTNQANSGDLSAQKALAKAYLFGELGLPKKPDEAARWYEQAARQGDRETQKRLAELYRSNPYGFPQDGNKAIQWYRTIGDADACFQLGILYYYGMGGVAVDFRQALAAWLRAEELGNRDVYNRIGALYVRTGDYATARSWFVKSSERSADDEEKMEAFASIGLLYIEGGNGIQRDYAQALSWIRKTYAKRRSVTRSINEARRNLHIADDLAPVRQNWETLSRNGNVDAELILLRLNKQN